MSAIDIDLAIKSVEAKLQRQEAAVKATRALLEAIKAARPKV